MSGSYMAYQKVLLWIGGGEICSRDNEGVKFDVGN